MPYEMRESGGRYCVYKEGDAEPMKCYDSEGEASDYLTALNLNADKEARKAIRFTQAEAAYVPLSTTAEAACANCRFFDAYMNACLIVENYPLDILPTGWCARHTPLPALEAEAPEADDEPTVEQMLETSSDDEYKALAPTRLWAISSDGSKTVGTPPAELVLRAQIEAQQAERDAAADADYAGKAQNAQRLSLVASVKAILNDRLRRRAEPDWSGFKAHGDRWVAWYSNNAKDRDGEYFPLKAIDAFIARVDAGMVPYPELWTYHIPGSKHGKADWLGRIGHYVVASGTFDATPAGQAAKAHYARSRKAYALSHGFTFKDESYRDSAFWDFNTFEISTLPPRVAANPYTLFQIEEKAMLTPEKTEQLKALFGEEIAAQIIAETEAKSKMLDTLQVEFKDFADIEAQKAAPDASGEKALAELLADVISENAETVTLVGALTKMVKSHQATVESRLTEHNQALQKALDAQQAEIKHLREQLDLRPRIASKDELTQTTPEADAVTHKAIEAAKNEAAAKFWTLG